MVVGRRRSGLVGVTGEARPTRPPRPNRRTRIGTRSPAPSKRSAVARHQRVRSFGVGAGVFDRLVEHPWTREYQFEVVAFNASQKATQADKYFNVRSASYWNLHDLLEAGRVALPDDPELLRELLATSWKPSAHGQVQLVPKEEIAGMLGRSPDRADSVVMALGQASRYSVGTMGDAAAC